VLHDEITKVAISIQRQLDEVILQFNRQASDIDFALV
jgi:hypothetical protein